MYRRLSKSIRQISNSALDKFLFNVVEQLTPNTFFIRDESEQKKILMDPERTMKNDCVALAFKIEVKLFGSTIQLSEIVTWVLFQFSGELTYVLCF